MVYEVNAKEIGRRLKELRGYKPRRVVAEELGISENTLVSYEMGERVPRDSMKIKLADYYKVPIQKLFFCASTTQNE